DAFRAQAGFVGGVLGDPVLPPEPPALLLERALRKQGKFAELSQKHLAEVGRIVAMPEGKFLVPPPLAEPFALREYAHQHVTRPDGIRRDFAETIYWHPVLVLPGDKALDVQF